MAASRPAVRPRAQGAASGVRDGAPTTEVARSWSSWRSLDSAAASSSTRRSPFPQGRARSAPRTTARHTRSDLLAARMRDRDRRWRRSRGHRSPRSSLLRGSFPKTSAGFTRYGTCPGDLTCYEVSDGGFCIPPASPVDCGGFAGVSCEEPTPVCMYVRDADFGPCRATLTQKCVCAHALGAIDGC